MSEAEGGEGRGSILFIQGLNLPPSYIQLSGPLNWFSLDGRKRAF